MGHSSTARLALTVPSLATCLVLLVGWMATTGPSAGAAGRLSGHSFGVAGDLAQERGLMEPSPAISDTPEGICDPVEPDDVSTDTTTGNLYHSITDLPLVAMGFPADLVRSYNSFDPNVGALGIGWTMSYFDRLVLDRGNQVLLRSGTGQEVAWWNTGDGADGPWDPDPAVTSTLGHDIAGWQVTNAEGLSRSFDETGRLLAVTAENGGNAVLTYDDAGRLVSLAADGGTVDLDYDPAGRLATASAGGAMTAYGYDAGGVVEVIDRCGWLVQYRYEGDRLVEEIGPSGPAESTTYDGAGRVVVRDLPGRPVTEFHWDTPKLGSCTVVQGGEVRVYASVGNVLTRVVEPDGTTTTFQRTPSSSSSTN